MKTNSVRLVQSSLKKHCFWHMVFCDRAFTPGKFKLQTLDFVKRENVVLFDKITLF